MHTISTIDLNASTLDVLDMIATIGEMEREQSAGILSNEDNLELIQLRTFAHTLRVDDGNFEYNGHRYPAVLIRDEYFPAYAKEIICEDVISARHSWLLDAIDWDKAVSGLRARYKSTTFAGSVYWYV